MGIFSRRKEEPAQQSNGPDLKAENERLKKEKRELKDEIADLKHEKKITEEDIKHMVRIREERIEVENEKKNLQRDREKEEAIAKVKDEYRDKMEKRLQTEVDNIREMYTEILARLPMVTVRQMDITEEKIGGAAEA